jgi:hypothetical protein
MRSASLNMAFTQKPLWLSVFGMLACVGFIGCDQSRYARQQVKIDRVQWTNAKEEAIVRGQQLDEGLLETLADNPAMMDLRIFTATRCEFPFFEELAKQTNLRSLSLFEVTLEDDELADLADAKKLNSIELYHTGIRGNSLERLHGLPLTKLTIHEKRMTLEGLQQLSGFSGLEELDLNLPNLPAAEIPSLATMPRLHRFSLCNGNYSYREYGGLRCLLGASSIRNLELSGVTLNDRSLKAVGSLVNLEKLAIDRHCITDEGLTYLTNLHYLRAFEFPARGTLNATADLRLAERLEPLKPSTGLSTGVAETSTNL